MQGLDRDAARLADVLDVIAIVIAAGLIILQSLGRADMPRLLLALAFTLFVPGRAIVSNLPELGRWSQVAVSMALAVATLELLATVTLWVHFWHPATLFDAVALVSLAGLAVGIARRRLGGNRAYRARDRRAALR